MTDVDLEVQQLDGLYAPGLADRPLKLGKTSQPRQGRTPLLAITPFIRAPVPQYFICS